MSQRLTWRDGSASKKTEGAKEFGMMKELQISQNDGTQGQKGREGRTRRD